jgi:hypothetical protein
MAQEVRYTWTFLHEDNLAQKLHKLGLVLDLFSESGRS